MKGQFGDREIMLSGSWMMWQSAVELSGLRHNVIGLVGDQVIRQSALEGFRVSIRKLGDWAFSVRAVMHKAMGRLA